MSHEHFDQLTRQLGAPITRRNMLKVIAGAAAGGVAAWLGETPKLVRATEACTFLRSDGSCQPGTTKKPKPGNVPSSNGCGPEGGSIKIPQGYGNADYTPACNNHDICYEDCQKPKSACDDDFYTGMKQACAAAYAGVLNSLKRAGCYERAYVYYKAVSNFGDDAWIAGQNKACKCCWDQKIYCACNKTCYDDVTVCLNACPVGLGCFTGICEPSQPDQCPAA
jgi:hypothetical protein